MTIRLTNRIFQLLILFTVFSLSYTSYGQRSMLIPDSIASNFYKEVDFKLKYWDTVGVDRRKGEYKQFNRWIYFWESRVMSDGTYPDRELLLNAWQEVENEATHKVSNELQAKSPWVELGPTEDPVGKIHQMGVGRLNVVRINPKNTNEIWVGSASGGAWVSRDGGSSWNVLYQTEFLSLGVSDIAIAPSNPRIVYVATGDNDGALTSFNFYSIGIIKSVDGGKTWTHTGLVNELAHSKLVSRIWVHPENENIVVAATSDGIYKSTDGGDTWQLKSEGFDLVDLEQMPNNPQVLYASSVSRTGMATTVVLRSSDGGETWKKILNLDGGRRTCIEVTPAAPASVYALTCNNTGGFHSLVVSSDAGNTWEQTNIFSNKRINYLGWASSTSDTTMRGQGVYDLAMAINPTNANNIFIGGINIWKSSNRGKDFSPVSHWVGFPGVPYVHADIHDLKFVGTKLYAAHDGGLDVTNNDGQKWIPLNKGLGIGQIYRFSNSKQNPQRIIIGMQDLGTRIRNEKWEYLGDGDGMDCAFDPKDDNRLYYSVYHGRFYRSYKGTSTGIISSNIIKTSLGVIDTAAWVAPLVISPLNPKKLYVGFCNIYFSNDYGNTWEKQTDFSVAYTSTFRKMRISTSDDQYVYASTLRGLYKTTDGGKKWLNVNHPKPNLNITDIAVDHKDPNIIYLTYSGFNKNEKLYRFDGTTWTNLSGNLPNVPANCVELHYNNNNVLQIYVGTDIGVYNAAENIPYFKRWGEGLPNLFISQLEVVPKLDKIRAASYGRGVWETKLNQCALETIIIKPENNNTEICEGDSVKLYIETPDQNDILWSTGETTKEIWAKNDGIYWAATNSNSECYKISNIVEIKVKPKRALNITTTGYTDFCLGDSVILTANIGFVNDSYMWSNGVKSREVVIKEAGDYYVQATNNNGCISKSQIITIKTYPKPKPTTITLIEGVYDETTKKRYDTLVAMSEGSKYIWYKDDKVINNPQAKSQKLVILYGEETLGNYSVSVAVGGDCYSDISQPYNYTSIDDEIAAKFTVHPNPAKNNLTVELNERFANNYNISILNLQGTEVLKLENIFISNKLDVNIEKLITGTYVLYLTSSSHKFMKKFMKE